MDLGADLMAKVKKVVLYSGSGCAKCREAKLYLQAKGIAFVEFDVQKSRRGAKEFARLKGRAVPILMIGSTRMDGFDKRRFDVLYQD